MLKWCGCTVCKCFYCAQSVYSYFKRRVNIYR